MKELQSLSLDIRVLGEDGEEIELSSLGDDDIAPPNIVSSDDDITEEDIGSAVETDDMYNSYQEESFDNLEGPDEEMLFAADRGEFGFGDLDMDDNF